MRTVACCVSASIRAMGLFCSVNGLFCPYVSGCRFLLPCSTGLFCSRSKSLRLTVRMCMGPRTLHAGLKTQDTRTLHYIHFIYTHTHTLHRESERERERERERYVPRAQYVGSGHAHCRSVASTWEARGLESSPVCVQEHTWEHASVGVCGGGKGGVRVHARVRCLRGCVRLMLASCSWTSGT